MNILKNKKVVDFDHNQFLTRDFGKLKYDHTLYFENSSSATCKNIPFSKLVLSRSRCKGMQNALALMKQAANGLKGKRLPLEVERYDNKFLIIDGNSTAIIGYLSDWPDIPCELS